MASVSEKYIGKSKYKNVYIIDHNETIQYKVKITIKNNTLLKVYNCEKEAAKCVDMFLIRNGKEPINILKRK